MLQAGWEEDSEGKRGPPRRPGTAGRQPSWSRRCPGCGPWGPTWGQPLGTSSPVLP